MASKEQFVRYEFRFPVSEEYLELVLYEEVIREAGTYPADALPKEAEIRTKPKVVHKRPREM
jgi:hypothetical protein